MESAGRTGRVGEHRGDQPAGAGFRRDHRHSMVLEQAHNLSSASDESLVHARERKIHVGRL
jgi:hypothetical protein